MSLLALALLAAHQLSHIKANLDYGKFQTIAHAPAASTTYITSALLPLNYEQQKPPWPASLTRNNWFILQSASNNAGTVQAPLESSLNQPTKLTTASLNKSAKQITLEEESYPLKYYAYDSSNNGNYHLAKKDMRNIEPYILTISNTRNPHKPLSVNTKAEQSQKNSSSQVNLIHQWLPSSVRSAGRHKNPGGTQPKVSSLFDWQDIKHKGKNEIGNNGHFDNSRKVDDVEKIVNSMERAGFNDVLMPLAEILDSVKYYCEALKEVINEDDEDLPNANLLPLNEVEAVTRTASALSTQTAGGTTQLLASKVQGRHSVGHLKTQQSAEMAMLSPTTTTHLNMPRSSALTTASSSPPATLNTTNSTTTTTATAKSLTSTALFIGRGKKLKRKLKKLMLPLLLAYKLKFIALVPLLIGGLTLLVGSTGLAGFFFALFVTIMALKAGGGGAGSANKSIVINKEW